MSNPEHKDPPVDSLVDELNKLVKEGVLTVEESKSLGISRKDLELPITYDNLSKEKILALFHTDDFPRPHVHSSKPEPLN